MSQEQAHHIYQTRFITIIIDGKEIRAPVSEDETINEGIARHIQMVGYQLKSNHFFLCGDIVLNANFTFGFYRTHLFTQGNKIEVMEKFPIQNIVTAAKNTYNQWELNKLIEMLTEAKSEVIKLKMREAMAFERYERNRGVQRLNKLLKEKAKNDE